VWSQNIKRTQDQLAAHWTFKSPAVMLQQGRVFAAPVPRLDLLTAANLKATPAALDLGVVPGGSGWLSYGLASSKPVGHSYFERRKDQPLDTSAPVEYRYWIVASAAPAKLGYRRITELLWQQFGSPGLRQAPDLQRNVRRPELLLFDDWRHEAWTR